MSDIKFPTGLFFSRKPKTPDFVIGKISVHVEDFIKFLKAEGTEYVNMDIKISKGGKYYVEVDTWKPGERESKESEATNINDINF